ncbi:DEAD/DEAH box helicase [Halomonas getboli]|uniref:DEAD/DEAH box helicase n=1 Tax=Halomonas getboli TaxID=2935862 RepID=UPI001FFE49BF|nr:DEAD/DEAH box helicase [Halomonas getboli]MCK2183591.1 DEAD/DEAH box helicase [Halomonas getboli]
MGQQLAPGMRLEIRDAEWRLTRLDQTSDGGQQLSCTGLSELVRGREAKFLTRLEDDIRILDPATTELVDDLSQGHRAGLLTLATQLRDTTPTDDRIHMGHHAAMDALPFQLEPTRQALAQPRARMLIADAVGLGKTLEAGILTSELIARGRGKRILVLAVKSMLGQFQQEFWNRFTIPLTRLDSQGLARVRNRIPANHNPFHYFDRSIISIDTLKQDIEYRHYLEQAHWDIIIIDEAHNVAERAGGQGASQRARLARLLATRSDTLIMLSATPHDGKPESFASLMNMLDPTAITNPSQYAHEDFRDKGLVIRRFKKDVRDQLGDFPDRQIDRHYATASAHEEHAFEQLMDVTFHTLDGQRTAGSGLFRTRLEKTLFSSPAACLSTIENRLAKLQKQAHTPERSADIDSLEGLALAVRAITPEHFSKYQSLLELLGKKPGQGEMGWQRDADDRLVIFTESLTTLAFLEAHLPGDIGLKAKQVGVLRGTDRDRDIMATVEAFNRGDSPLRLLLCSDVAAEGINLHHRAHRMVHFDIPWSLMVFQQRNGRIDRYGQTQPPQIRYLITESEHPKVRGDQRVLEVLIDKDDQASRNIGDPSEFTAGRTQEEQEAQVTEVLERDDDPDDLSALFAGLLDDQLNDSESPLDAFIPDTRPATTLDELTTQPPRLYPSTLAWSRAAIDWLRQAMREQGQELQASVDEQAQRLELTAPEDLRQRLTYLPREIRPEHDRFILTADAQRMQQALDQARQEDDPWPVVQYLWPLHPVLEWLRDRILNAFGRHTAPVIRVPAALPEGQARVLLHGGYPNRRGQALIQSWCAVPIDTSDGSVGEPMSLDDALSELALDPESLPNPGIPGDNSLLQATLPDAVKAAKRYLHEVRVQREGEINDRLNAQMNAMDALKTRHQQQIELDLSSSREQESRKQRRRDERTARLEHIFKDYENWLEATQQIENQPWLQVAAVFTGDPATSAVPGT